MTEAFWRSLGRGTLIPEYPLAAREPGSQRRAIDALIVLDAEFTQHSWRDWPDLSGRPVMIVQTKPYQTDAVLIGQAVFSPLLLRRDHPAIGRIESVVLSPKPEPAFRDLLQRHGVREVTVPGPTGRMTKATYPRVAEIYLDQLHARLGGEMLLRAQLNGPDGRHAILKVDAAILPDRPWKRTSSDVDRAIASLVPGARVTAVVSTRKPLGMGVAGRALVAQHLLRAAGAADVHSVALVGIDDVAVQSSLRKFDGLSAEVVPSAAWATSRLA
jgi:hypothetical protein